jgi:predicted dehydrogenase
MYHAIVNGEAPVTAQEGVQVMEVITAAIQSSAEKK